MELTKFKKIDLEKICKEKGISTTGKKSDLLKRIQKYKNWFPDKKNLIVFPHDNHLFIYPRENWVINKNTNTVIGKLDDGENIRYLTKKELFRCKEMGIPFEIPPIIDGKSSGKKKRETNEFDDVSDEED